MPEPPTGDDEIVTIHDRAPQTRPIRRCLVLTTALLAVLAAACSDDANDAVSSPSSSSPTTEAAPDPAETTPTTPATTAVEAVTTSPATDDDGPALTPLVGEVREAPVLFEMSDGREHLVYEIVASNFAPFDVDVQQVEVLASDGDEVVAAYDQDEMATRLLPLGTGEYSTTVGAGRTSIAYMHVVLEAGTTIPAAITHRLTLSFADGSGDDVTVVQPFGPTAVEQRTLPVLGPPMIGDGYLAADGCCDAVRHTRALLALDGATYLSQRYAIDWEQLDAEGRVYVGDREDPASYAIYGDEALAVADGTVVSILEGLPEQVPGTIPEDISATDADGNSVVLDIGDGFYVNYAHFQPGSVRVAPGDRVQRGDVLGLVGNTGRSLAPHLHLHVMDGPSPLLAEGLPYVIDRFETTAVAASTEDFDAAEADGTPLVTLPGLTPTEHRDVLVLDQSVVNFTGP